MDLAKLSSTSSPRCSPAAARAAKTKMTSEHQVAIISNFESCRFALSDVAVRGRPRSVFSCCTAPSSIITLNKVCEKSNDFRNEI